MTDVMTRLVNCLVKALNDNNKLSRIILVISDINLLKHMDPDCICHGIKIISNEVCQRIVSQMARAVDTKKEILTSKVPGSVNHGEPKVIWVKMINRLHDAGSDDFLAMRRKYNDMMEDTLVDFKHHYVLDISDKIDDPAWFLRDGTLNCVGKTKYWLTIDKAVEKFDKQIISLKPTRPKL